MIHSCKWENQENQKKQKQQDNQEDLLGQSASDLGLFFFVLFLFAILHAPREGCRPKKKEKQEDLLGQSASDIGLFFCFVFFWFLFAILHAPREGCRELSLVICLQFCMPQGKDAESWVLSFVCSFTCPKGRMQRVESCHLFAVLHAPRQRCRELSLVICLQFYMPQGKDAESWVLSFSCFLVSQCICQNRECAKRSAKSALWWSPVLKKDTDIHQQPPKVLGKWRNLKKNHAGRTSIMISRQQFSLVFLWCIAWLRYSL